MADEKQAAAPTVGQRFPALKDLEEQVEKAKLEQARDEARAARAKAVLPALDAELTKDTVADSERPTGLGKVLVQRAGETLSHNVAVLALRAIDQAVAGEAKPSIRMLVTSDPAALGDLDVYRQLLEEHGRLEKRLKHLLPAAQDHANAGKSEAAAKLRFTAVPPGLIVDGAVKATGLASKLFAHDYRFASQEVAVDGLGIDVDVAGKLMAHDGVHVELARFRRPREAKIAGKVADLVTRAVLELAPKAAEKAEATAEATAAVAAAQAQVTAADEQLAALMGHLDAEAAVTAATALRGERVTLVEGLATDQGALAAAQRAGEPWSALLEDIQAFHALVHATTDAGDSLLVRAARGESLDDKADDALTHVLCVRAVAGGVDEVTDTRVVFEDRWNAVSGVAVEMILIDATGKLLVSNVLSVLKAASMTVGKPETLEEKAVQGFELKDG